MYRVLTIMVLCALFSEVACGQVLNTRQADSVMKLIDSRIESTTTQIIDFRLVRSFSALTNKVEHDGIIHFQSPDKLSYVLRGDRPWLMVVDGPDVIVKDGDNPAQKRGKGMSKLKDFIVSSLNGETLRNDDFFKKFVAEGSLVTVKLTPKPTQLKKYMKEIQVHFDSNHDVSDFVLLQPNGDSTHYSFSNLIRNSKLDAELFKLK